MNECSRCGECCRWMTVARKKGLTPWQLAYLRERCDREDDQYFLLDSPCKHLGSVWVPDDDDIPGTCKRGHLEYRCRIYETRPQICKDYCGKRYTNGQIYYVPEDCNMSSGAEDKRKEKGIK